MQIESLESRTFLSADGTVTVPLKDSVTGNLPANLFDATVEGRATHLGRFTGAFNDAGVLVFTAANGDELWIVPTSLTQTSATVLHAEAQIIGGTGRFEGASGFGSHDIFLVNDQGDFVFNAETMITLQRPWNAGA